MIAGRKARQRRRDALGARARADRVAQNDEVHCAAVRFGLAMDALRARPDIALGAAHLARRAVVGVVALDQDAAACPALDDRRSLLRSSRCSMRPTCSRSRRTRCARRCPGCPSPARSVEVTSSAAAVADDDGRLSGIERGRIEIELAVASRAVREKKREYAREPGAPAHQRVPARMASASARAKPPG